MTYPRSSLVSLADTHWYHCVSRCVRRAYLCGVDRITGKDYGHRRDWIVNRIKALANIFLIDIAAYAVMSNHYHIVVHINAERACALSTEDVLRRWSALFNGPDLVRSFLEHGRVAMNASDQARVDALAVTHRQRLHDLSWFARILNESVAKMANGEDNCRGRFWEGRFKTQALLDQRAVLAAMVYVDLNPIRAGMAELPEAALHASIHERIHGTRQEAADTFNGQAAPLAPLMPFQSPGAVGGAIPFRSHDYIELVDLVGRQRRPDKRGWIDAGHPSILDRTGLDPACFIDLTENLLGRFGRAVGTAASLSALCDRQDVKYVRGVRAARKALR